MPFLRENRKQRVLSVTAGRIFSSLEHHNSISYNEKQPKIGILVKISTYSYLLLGRIDSLGYTDHRYRRKPDAPLLSPRSR